MKDAFYLKHDLTARRDPKMGRLLRAHGLRGYGVFWSLAELIHEQAGEIEADYEHIAFELRDDAKFIEAVITGFGLFQVKDGRVRSSRIDRDLSARGALREQASMAGKKSAAARRVQRSLNGRSTDPLPGEERREEDITAAPAAADLHQKISTTVDKLGISRLGKDLLALQLPFSFGDIPKGRRVQDIDADSARAILARMPTLGLDLRRALEARIKAKQDELHPELRK